MRGVSSVRFGRRVSLVAVAVIVAAMALPASSGATMPGGNGRIAFNKYIELSESSGETAIWSINPDGSGPTQLVKGEEPVEGTYSPDGSRLAFERYDEIFVAAADGSNSRAIAVGTTKNTTSTHWVANYEDPKTATVYPWVKVEENREERDARSQPSFSPDGSALAVVHYSGTFIFSFVCSVNAKNDTNCNGEYTEYLFQCPDCGSAIETIDSNTGALLGTFVPKMAGIYLNSPTYSHSGAVAFIRETDDGAEDQLVSVSTPGGAPTTLAGGEVREPEFSPDGSRIVYASSRHNIGIVGAGGGAPTVIPVSPPVATDKVWTTESPIWSPDGSLIAFGDLGAPGGGGLERYSDGGIFLMHPDGSAMTQVQGDATVPTGWQPLPLPPPPPPVVRARGVKGKKKVRLSKKGVGVVGKIVCGSTACAPKATGAKLKVGKKRFGVKAIVPKSVLPGATAVLKVKVKGKALAALKARHAGKLTLKVAVAEGGGTETLPFTPKLLPPKRQRR